MDGYLALVLHAHLPYVRHPEHAQFLEENWLFEAITETYLPLLQFIEGWRREGIRAPITLTLSPTLCSMLQDSLLRERYVGHLNRLIELAEKEVHRTHWEKPYNQIAQFYFERLSGCRELYHARQMDLIGAFRELQNAGAIEIITCAATHAVLPLLSSHPSSIRAQLLVARDHYQTCFGHAPRGIWLPECAYYEGLEVFLEEAGLAWFIVDTHGVLHARPKPRYGMFAPIFTENGVAVFGRDLDSAKQVWSRDEGYPGDPRYRDFYRDIGFDVDFDYAKQYLPINQRAFTGIKYHRIGAKNGTKEIYERFAALEAVKEHATDFLRARVQQVQRIHKIMEQPPIFVCPYDAELFGHWWYEGPEFLDNFVRSAHHQNSVNLITPSEFLSVHPTHQIATPSASSWGEEGFWRVWLNEQNEWIYRHLNVAQDRMIELVKQTDEVSDLTGRALRQAGRELLLAQSSDWPFIIRTGTSPQYATGRLRAHLGQFTSLYEQIKSGCIDEPQLAQVEQRDNLFPSLDWRHWH
jgi:1,4-alpha-glucan branching enzyme